MMIENELQKKYRQYYCKSPLMIWLEGRGNSSDIALKYNLSFDDTAVQHQLVFRYPLNYKNSFVKLLRENEQDTGYLSEGLIATYPVRVLEKQYMRYVAEVLPDKLMKLKFKDTDMQTVISTFDVRELDVKTGIAGLVTVYFPYYDNSVANKAAKEFSEMAHASGYDLSDHAKIDFDGKLTDEDGDSVNVMQLTYEAKFYKKEFKLPEWLYHVTTIEVAKKILKRGFIPKSENKTYAYQDRTYLFASLKPIDILSALLSKDFLKDPDQTFVMLRVSRQKLETSSLYKTGKMTFYVDPKYNMHDNIPTAIYTHNNIPANIVDNECVTFNINDMQICQVKQTKTTSIIS